MHAAKRARIGADAASSSSSTTALPMALNASVAAQASAPSAAPAHRFLSHVLLLATAQLTREAGFSHTRSSNLQILGELLAKYIESIGVSASGVASQAGRSEVNAHDMMHALSEMGLEFGEMKQWTELSEPAPSFVHCMPPFPISQPVIVVEPATMTQGNASAASAAAGGAGASSSVFPPRPPHIPLCLPAFPPKRTYAFTPDVKSPAATAALEAAAAAAAKPGEPATAATTTTSKRRRVEENRKLERALVTLHQAAVKAGLEQAQLLAQQELNLQERILNEPLPSAVQVPVPAAALPVQPSAAMAAPSVQLAAPAPPAAAAVAAASSPASAAPAVSPSLAASPLPVAAAAATAVGASAGSTEGATVPSAPVPMDESGDAPPPRPQPAVKQEVVKQEDAAAASSAAPVAPASSPVAAAPASSPAPAP